MFRGMHLRRVFLFLTAGFVIVGASAALAMAQKPGDKVEYKAQNWPEKWEVGTFVKVLPGGTQVLIREKPTEFFPEGSEKAYALSEVRPIAKAPVNDPDTPPNPPDNPRDDEPGRGDNPAGGPQMSQQDILAYLRNRLGDGDPFRNPNRLRILEELRAEVLRRGVNFRFHGIGDFANKVGKYGAPSNFDAAMTDNFGPLAKVNELYGKWLFTKVGAPGNPRFGNDNDGSLVVNANGSYVWNTASGVVRGNWRKATADEMDKVDKGGEGLVLQNAKSGSDWLAIKRNEEGPEGQGIMLYILPSHNLRERGTR